MLFKTVYGPELQCIYDFLLIHGSYTKDALYRHFVPIKEGRLGTQANMDDAMAFLLTVGIIRKDEVGKYQALSGNNGFRLLALQHMREIQLGKREGMGNLDSWYMRLVEDFFVKPDRKVGFDLHQRFNALEPPEILSVEKVNAWKRVLEFMGIGHRLFGGFICLYSLELIMELLKAWGEKEGPLQGFLEDGVNSYLPWQTEKGDIASALWMPLSELEQKGLVKLERRQDLPYRAYGGERQIKWIRKEGILQ